MSCLLNSGLAQPCNYEFGGLSDLYITNHAQVAGITDEDTDNVLDTVDFGTSGGVFYKFVVNNNSASFNESIQFGASGNKYFLQTLTFSYSGTDQDSTDVFEVLGLSKILVIAEYKNGKRKVVFRTNPGQVSVLDNASGAAEGDAYGFTITFTASQTGLAPSFDTEGTIEI